MSGGVWAKLPLGPGVAVLAHDANGLGALSKPVGVLAHPNESGADKRALLASRYDLSKEAYEWDASGAPKALFLLNRLDSATSGVILVATSEELARQIRDLFRQRRVSKTYVARVFGRPVPGPTVWKDRLQVEKAGRMIRGKTGLGIESESVATVIRAGRGEPVTSLLKLVPRTGRSHQLRIQCATRGVPIIGDQTYGDFPRNREFAKVTGEKRLFLHSLETAFKYEWKGRTYSFVAHAPLPPEFDVEVRSKG